MKQVNCSLKQLSIIQDGNMERLDVERSLLSAELDRADVLRERLAAAATLFKAL